MNKRYIFTWKDELEEAKVKAFAKDNGMTISKAMHRIIEMIPAVGTVKWDSGEVKLVTQSDIPEREYIGNDTGRE